MILTGASKRARLQIHEDPDRHRMHRTSCALFVFLPQYRTPHVAFLGDFESFHPGPETEEISPFVLVSIDPSRPTRDHLTPTEKKNKTLRHSPVPRASESRAGAGEPKTPWQRNPNRAGRPRFQRLRGLHHERFDVLSLHYSAWVEGKLELE